MERHQDTSRRTTDRRKHRYMQKRMIMTFLALLLMTGAGVLAALFVPQKEQNGEVTGKDTLQTSARPAKKEQNTKKPDQEPKQIGRAHV